MSNNIPNDITIEILLKLPTKSLVRFKGVGKSWRSLIEDHQFVKQHVDTCKRDINCHKILLFLRKTDNYYSIDAPLQHDSCVSVIPQPPPGIKISWIDGSMSSCNGLFLLRLPFDNVGLWNPATGESRKIPCPIARGCAALYGLGYVSSLDDYKITRVGYVSCKRAREYEIEIEIFSAKSDTWKSLGELPPNFRLILQMVVVDGIVYMILFDKTNYSDIFVLSLCLKTENFEKLKCPDNVGLMIDNTTLFTLGESIFLAKSSPYYTEMFSLEIWCMNKNGISSNSWSKTLAITVPRGYSIRPVPMLGLTKDGDMLFLWRPKDIGYKRMGETKLVVYDSKTRNFKEVEVVGLEDSVFLDVAVTYAETLVSPNAI